MMNMNKITSTLMALLLCLSAQNAHAAIQSTYSDADIFMTAELDNSAADHKNNVMRSFSELNKMIEPAAGESESHAQKMHDSHHAAVDGAHAPAGSHNSAIDHSAEHGTGGLPQFDPTWFASQIFWLTITFAFMYLFFAKKGLPAIANSLDARETRIKTDIETAEKINEQAASVKSDYERTLKESKEKSSAILNATQEELKGKANEAVEAFRANQDKVTADLDKSIARAKAAALSDMHGVAATAAMQAASKIIDVETDISAVKSVVQKLDKAA
jgi:F-type H+-transporting ATPase subunit b|tara:strand:+ start:128698 stop:129516 length:819 start_codon:yes stop_codon:yes gene_type:complete